MLTRTLAGNTTLSLRTYERQQQMYLDTIDEPTEMARGDRRNDSLGSWDVEPHKRTTNYVVYANIAHNTKCVAIYRRVSTRYHSLMTYSTR